jgi:hypothetical protein
MNATDYRHQAIKAAVDLFSSMPFDKSLQLLIVTLIRIERGEYGLQPFAKDQSYKETATEVSLIAYLIATIGDDSVCNTLLKETKVSSNNN